MESILSKRVANNLRVLRKRLKMSQRKFAEEIHFDCTSYANFETNRKQPKIDFIEYIIGYYRQQGVDISFASFFGEDLTE